MIHRVSVTAVLHINIADVGLRGDFAEFRESFEGVGNWIEPRENHFASP